MQFYQHYLKAKQIVSALVAYTRQKVTNLWDRAKPTIERLTQAGIALHTSFSAFKSTLEMVPIIFAGLSILATAPLLSYLMPAMLFDTTVMMLVLAGISGVVGYSKYHELKLRSELDAQTRKQGRKIEKLSNKLSAVQMQLKDIMTAVVPTKSSNGHYPLRETRARTERRNGIIVAMNDSQALPNPSTRRRNRA